MDRSGYWNHNVHYQSVILEAVPADCATALDVGCGDGMLACRLAECCAEVTGIDRDARMIAVARARAGAQQQQQPVLARAASQGRVRFIEADFLACPIEEASVDFVCANTSLHHMNFAGALAAMARVLRPGGRLAVIGLAADTSVGDYLAAAPALPVDLAYRAIYRRGESGAPVKDPDMGWGEVRAVAGRVLPGLHYRRHLLWRYSLLWRKPA